MERLLAQHGRHRVRHRLVGADLLHRELILPDAVDDGGEAHVVDERVVLEVEGVEHVGAGLHGEDLLDHLLAPHSPGGLAPVLREQQVEHLIAVAQLLGHHAQHPEAVLVVLGARQGPRVLLDRSELGGGLGADDGEQVLRLLLGELAGVQALLLALVVADPHSLGRAELHLGAQAEGLVLGEVPVPVPEQRVVIRHPVTAPVLDGVVVLLLEDDVLALHAVSPTAYRPPASSASRSSRAWSAEGAKPTALRNPATPASLRSTRVRTAVASCDLKWATMASNICLPMSRPRYSGSIPKRSIHPLGSSIPNSPARTSPSMNPTTLPSTSATCEESGSRRR